MLGFQKDLYTIGHSIHSEFSFIKLLKHYDINILVDVRSLPGSNYVPQFNKENMECWLLAAGFRYIHMPILGGKRNKNKTTDQSLISGWKNASFKNYAGYTLTPEYQSGIGRLKNLIGDNNVCIMCSESVPWRCHRLIISNTLVAQNVCVKHIMSEKSVIAHAFGSYGAKPVLKEDGSIIYPNMQCALDI